jgi:hypothetical protein
MYCRWIVDEGEATDNFHERGPGVEIGFTGFVSQFSMVVEANYGGARSEGSWMDTWGVRI